MYEYGNSRYKTAWYWRDFGFTFMEIPSELKGSRDPTEAIMQVTHYQSRIWKIHHNIMKCAWKILYSWTLCSVSVHVLLPVYRSPLSVGNWAINRTFFFEIGGMDTDMKLWGGENFDLSIRVRSMAFWQHPHAISYLAILMGKFDLAIRWELGISWSTAPTGR